jgi:hypothetical protein
MPYVDAGQKFTEIGHCRNKDCRGQWVIAPGTKGKRGNHRDTYNGQRCPYCGCSSIRYTKERNR